MPLDKILINHLDEQDILEEKIDEDIESLMRGLSVDDLMENSEIILMDLVEQLQEQLQKFYYPKSSESGIKFAKDIEEDGDIQIQDSNNPNLNEEIVDGS